MEKPTLHEIAAMPFPASEQALFKYYGVKPRRGDTGEEQASYRVTIDWSYTVEETSDFDVEASSEEEAREIAEQQLRDEEGGSENFGIDHVVTRRLDA